MDGEKVRSSSPCLLWLRTPQQQWSIQSRIARLRLYFREVSISQESQLEQRIMQGSPKEWQQDPERS